MTLAPTTPSACIGQGQVRHTRWWPRQHAFAYSTFFLWLPMRQLHQARSWGLAVNRPGWISYHDADHGDGRAAQAGGALAWLLETLKAHGIDDADGEVWLHSYPRVLGYAFKPVSFWHCHTASGSLRAILVEVNNTFGERHCYLLDSPAHGQTLVAAKHFHVSPFCTVQGHYQFRFKLSRHEPPRLIARIDHLNDHGLVLTTSVSGELHPINRHRLLLAALSHPLLSLGIMARIHWQALRLWLKGVPFFRKPPTPPTSVTCTTPDQTGTLEASPLRRTG